MTLMVPKRRNVDDEGMHGLHEGGRIRLVAGRWVKAEEEQKKTPPQKEAHV